MRPADQQDPADGAPFPSATTESGPETGGAGLEEPASEPGHGLSGEGETLQPQGMIPGRGRRRTKFERVAMRILATGGIIGIAVALGAILVSKHVDGWIVGLTIGLTSVILAAILWSSRQL